MDPQVFIVTAMPSVKKFAQGLVETFEHGQTKLSLTVAPTGTGAGVNDYGKLDFSKLYSVEIKKRGGRQVLYVEGLTAKSDAIPAGRYARGIALDPLTQEGEIYISDLVQ